MQAQLMLAPSAPQRCCNSRATGAGVGGAAAGAAWPARRRSRQQPATRAAAGRNDSATPQQKDAASLDVSGAVVSPAYRSTPWAAEQAAAAAGASRTPARIALVSESGICRGVLAAAALAAALQRRGLGEQVAVECRATQAYCVGEGPHEAAAAVAAELGLALPADYAVQQFEEARDIVDFDVVLVCDKFTAADVLREVSVFDTIKTWGLGGESYSSKVRRLGEFAPAAAAAAGRVDPEAGDIQDPLYGNVGGKEELAAVRRAAADMVAACEGFADFVAAVEQQHAQQAVQQGDGAAVAEGGDGGGGGARLGARLLAAVRGLEAMEWMVPPMLQPR